MMHSKQSGKDAERLRALATDYREIAKRLTSGGTRRQLLEWASFYESQARHIEARAPEPSYARPAQKAAP